MQARYWATAGAQSGQARVGADEHGKAYEEALNKIIRDSKARIQAAGKAR